MAVKMWLPSLKVGGRPLPPSPPGSAFPGRRQMAFNLQAVVPRWRPISCGAVGSRQLAPSGLVPGGNVFDCGGVCQHGGDGAGPDGVCIFFSRVYDAKCLDLVVIFYLFWSSLYFATVVNESF